MLRSAGLGRRWGTVAMLRSAGAEMANSGDAPAGAASSAPDGKLADLLGTDVSIQLKGRPNLGGKVKRLPACPVCDFLRTPDFHGNFCSKCERNMRARGRRSWLRLTPEEKRDIAAQSVAQRAAVLSKSDRKRSARIAEVVFQMLQEGRA